MKREGRPRIVNAKIWSLPRKLLKRPPPPGPVEPDPEAPPADDDHQDDELPDEGSEP